jgi:hypothetical protein
MKKMIFILITIVSAISGNALAVDMNQVKIHGFISQGYLQTDKNDFYFANTEKGTFQFNEMGINFGMELSDNLRVGVQFLSRDLGDIGNNKVEVDWAFADYRYRNWLGIWAGKIKKPYGLHNRSRDIDSARTSVFLPLCIYDDVSRETYLSTQGIGIYGLLPGGLSYEFQYGTTDMKADGGTARNTDFALGTVTSAIDADEQHALSLLWDTPIKGLLLSGTVFDISSIRMETSKGKMEMTKFTSSIGSLEYSYEKFKFTAEYRYHPAQVTLNGRMIADQTIEAWYAEADYKVSDWLGIGSYYSILYLDKDDKDGEKFKARNLPDDLAWRKDLAVFARFDINDYWIFKLEGHYIDGLAMVQTPPNQASDNWFLFAAKVTFSF